MRSYSLSRLGWGGHISLSENIKNLNSTQSKIKFQISRQKKTILKNSVDSFVQQANAIVQKSEASFERRIKNRVDTAYNISHRIYHENKDTLSSAEIKQRVKSVVASMVFGNDYMFIFDTSGMNILSPLLPHLEGGVNALNMQDAEGNYTTRNAIKVVEERNAGFFRRILGKAGGDGRT